MIETHDDRSIDASTLDAVDAIGRSVVAASAVLVLAAYALLGGDGAAGAVAGAALASGLWLASGAIARRMVAASDRGRVAWALAFVAESAVAFVLAAAALSCLPPAGFAIGFSAIVLGPIAGSLALGLGARAAARS